MSDAEWQCCDLDGEPPEGLLVRWLDLDCVDGSLRVQALGERILPEPELPEGVPLFTALATVAIWAVGHQALLRLPQPSRQLDGCGGGFDGLGRAGLGLLDGIRLIDVAEEADRALWDRALDAGLQLYGTLPHVCHRLGPGGAALMQALRFGEFLACAGEPPLDWLDDAHGAHWRLHEDTGRARVVVRGGMEASELAGAEGRWCDSGHEGWVRIELEDACGRRFSQPRLVAPRSPERL